MVKAIVNINNEANRVLNIVKAKENLKDKSDALNLVITMYGREMLGEDFKPEFIQELLSAQKEKSIKIKDFESRYRN